MSSVLERSTPGETRASRALASRDRASPAIARRPRVGSEGGAGIARDDAAAAGPHATATAFAAPSVIGTEHFYGHMLAGALAGTTEHCAMFPLDTIKTRMQTAVRGIAVSPAVRTAGATAAAAEIHSHFNPVSAMRHATRALMRAEGVAGLYRGISAVGIGAGPAHAVYFATYEHAKEALGGNANKNQHAPLAHAAAGMCATIAGDAVQTPVDTVKQRLQMSGSPYRGVVDCVSATVRAQGVGALYRSYPTTLAMNVPFTAIHFSSYESAKIAMRVDDEDKEETFAVQFLAGGAAGGLAAAVTTPLDVVKTRMQTHCEVAECELSATVKSELAPGGTGKGVCAVTGDPIACKAAGSGSPVGAAAALKNSNASGATVTSAATRSPYGTSNMAAAMRAVVAEEGAGALLRGLGPRVLFHIPAGAISWATYEYGKRVLGVSGSSGGGTHHH
jgi:solute carrier family 25 iron transporter 28/37